MTAKEIEDARWLRLMRFTFAEIGSFVGVSGNTVRRRLDARVAQRDCARPRGTRVGQWTPLSLYKRKCTAAGVEWRGHV